MYASFGKPGHKRLHRIWHGMKQRCYNEKCPAYKYYGARGIKICDEWLNDYDNFYNWAMDNGFDPESPKKECSIDRIDNDGNYCPENCRWATALQQAANQRKSSLNTSGYRGVILDYSERKVNKPWRAIVMVNYKTISLGSFETQEEALAVRNKYIKDHNLPHKIQKYTGEHIIVKKHEAKAKIYNIDDYIGKKYNKLTVIGYAGDEISRKWHNKTTICKCECGRELLVPLWELLNGTQKACKSCAARKYGQNIDTKSSRLYSRYKHIINRCYNPKEENYTRFGGKGIRVCDEWKNDFKAFYDWAISRGYDDKSTIIRLDTKTGNYNPENCRVVCLLPKLPEELKILMKINKHGYRGIRKEFSKIGNLRWKAVVIVNKKTISLGRYDTQKEALEKLNTYIIEHGLNYPIQEYHGETFTKEPKKQVYSSGYAGINFHKQSSKWKTGVGSIYLGYFNSLKEALDVRNKYIVDNNLNYPIQEYISGSNPNDIPRESRSKNTSGYIGMNWEKKTAKWQVRLTVNHKRIRLGLYKTQKEALEVRNKYIIDNGLDYPIQEYKGEIGIKIEV